MNDVTVVFSRHAEKVSASSPRVGVTVVAPVAAGGARAGGVSPSVSVPVPAAVARAGAIAPAVIIGPAVLYVIEVPPDYHLPADHDDFVATGTEIALALVVLFVGARLVAVRFSAF